MSDDYYRPPQQNGSRNDQRGYSSANSTNPTNVAPRNNSHKSGVKEIKKYEVTICSMMMIPINLSPD